MSYFLYDVCTEILQSWSNCRFRNLNYWESPTCWKVEDLDDVVLEDGRCLFQKMTISRPSIFYVKSSEHPGKSCDRFLGVCSVSWSPRANCWWMSPESSAEQELLTSLNQEQQQARSCRICRVWFCRFEFDLMSSLLFTQRNVRSLRVDVFNNLRSALTDLMPFVFLLDCPLRLPFPSMLVRRMLLRFSKTVSANSVWCFGPFPRLISRVCFDLYHRIFITFCDSGAYGSLFDEALFFEYDFRRWPILFPNFKKHIQRSENTAVWDLLSRIFCLSSGWNVHTSVDSSIRVFWQKMILLRHVCRLLNVAHHGNRCFAGYPFSLCFLVRFMPL